MIVARASSWLQVAVIVLAGALPGLADELAEDLAPPPVRNIVPVAAWDGQRPASGPALPVPAVMADYGRLSDAEAEAAFERNLAEAEACPLLLDLVAASPVTLELTLLAPCLAGQQIVLRQDGQTLVTRASGHGALFQTLPALAGETRIDVILADGRQISRRIATPEAGLVAAAAARWEMDAEF